VKWVGGCSCCVLSDGGRALTLRLGSAQEKEDDPTGSESKRQQRHA
jgi:hypothetical protein